MRRWAGVCAIAAIGLVTGVTALRAAEGGKSAEPQKVTSVEGITEYRLANGLRVLLFPDQSKPTVTVNATYFVGSRHEGYGETGMAHLLEHMVFKGTPKHPQIWKSLQDHGANFNGSTNFDRTNYFETLAANDENLEFALAMEADRMVNSNIARKDLDSEFSVVRNEFEMGENSPVNVLSERMYSSAYLWHNYGKSTIGSREDIERVPIDRLKAFYTKFYQPDNAMLVVAGKFDPVKTLARVNELFGSIPKPARVLEPTYTVEPPQDGEREVVLRRVGDVQAVGCLYHICAGTHTDMPALDMLADILTADQTGRLYKALVESQLATSVRGSADALAEPGVLEVLAEVRLDKSLDDARKALLSTLDGLAAAEFTAEELDRAKNAFAKQFELMMGDPGRVGIRLSEFGAQGDWRLMFLYRDRVAGVTVADLKRVAMAYLKPANRTVGMFMPTKSPERTRVPATPDLASVLKEYKGHEAVAEGEAFDSTPMTIESRTTRTQTPYGMKLAMLPKKTRGKKVNATLTLRYGNLKELTGKAQATALLGPMLMAGTPKHTKRQIQDEFDRLKAQVSIGGGGGRRMAGMMSAAMGGTPGVLTVNIETVRANLPAVLELVAECLKESNFPEQEFEKMRKQSLAAVEQMMSEPMTLAMVEFRRRTMPMQPDDPRYVTTFAERAERLKAVKLDDVKKVYTEMVGAGAAELAMVGDFDASEVRTIVDHLFGNWKSAVAFARIETPYIEARPDLAVINTPDKANALIVLGTNLQIRDDDPDYPALLMANYILGGNANSRLINRLRQKEGFSYSVSSSLGASAKDRVAMFSAFAICNPNNAEKAIAAAREEMTRLVKDGVTQQELDDARKGYFEDFKVGLSNDGMVSMTLARQSFEGRTMKFTDAQLTAIRELTPAAVTAAAAKYLVPERLIVIRAGDFQKGGGEAGGR
ncbi:MAG: pitrilysin family protein [Phycisphaerae bacterium]